MYGNAILTGWQSNEDGGSDFLTLQYNSSGDLNWGRVRTAPLTTTKAKSKSLVIDNNGNVIIAGELIEGGKSEIIVNQYDNSGQSKWSINVSHPNAILNVPLGLNINNLDEIFLTTISKEEFNNYTTYKFNTLSRPLIPVLDANDEATHIDKELIIKFAPGVPNNSFIDNIDYRFNEVGNGILDLECIEQIESFLNISDFEQWNLIKVHPNKKSTDQFTTTRLGEIIRTPDFYNTMILLIPRAFEEKRLEDIISILNDSISDCCIQYAEINPVASFDDCDDPPNDPANDDLYGDFQANLHPTSAYQYGHINMKPAWCTAGAGDSETRVAVIDTGVRWSHEDFGDGTFDGSVVIDGYDYGSSEPISANSENDDGNHGTKVASIIGSIRNNNLGVAGIAGGTGAMDGVRLIAQRAFGDLPASFITTAMEESYSLFDADVITISGHTLMETGAMREVAHHLNRVWVVICASRGNFGEQNVPQYPGSLQDEWIVTVGGTNTEDNYNNQRSIGPPIDVAGPSRWEITRTAANLNQSGQPSDQAYGGISLSSGATPHATGVAALLMSYSETSLVQEDVEYILKESAKDVDADPAMPGPDDYKGHGLIDAGAAIKMIEEPCKVFHIGSNNNLVYDFSSTLVEEDVYWDMNLESYTNANGQTFPPGIYYADVYEVQVSINHNLPSNYVVSDHFWVRHSSSSLFGEYISAGFYDPVEHVEIVSSSSTAITLRGYAYYVKSEDCSFEDWITGEPKMAQWNYSLIACEDMIIETDELTKETLKVFPNPTSDLLYFQSNLISEISELAFSLYDFSGKEIMLTSQLQILKENGIIQLNINDFPQGIYFAVVTSGDKTISTKFTKL